LARTVRKQNAEPIETRSEVAPARALRVLPARDAQANERRRQLVHVASDLIEEGGVDAVTLPAVTERAGCARTLVYRYFASREELLVAVLRDYFERLEARIPKAELRRALATFFTPKGLSDVEAARGLVAVFWDVQIAAGLGGAILRVTPLSNPQVRSLVDDARRRYERLITDPMSAIGLSAVERQVAVDSMIASIVGLALRWRAGEIDRQTAIDLQARVTIGLMRGLVDGRKPRASRAARRSPKSRTQG